MYRSAAMKTQHKNIFKAGLKLVVALLSTIFSVLHSVIYSLFSSSNSNDEEEQEFYARTDEGKLVSYDSKGQYKIIGK